MVTLALEGDVQVVADAGLIEDGFADEFEQESSPYTSTIVFLVRKGNPKSIEDWDDLLREDVGVITPNPKTSGGARWNYLAAWYYFESQGQSEEEITENMKTLYHNVLVLDSGARGATTTFAENGQGDVLIAWENEAFCRWRNIRASMRSWFRLYRFSASRPWHSWTRSSMTGAQGRLLQSI